MKLIDTNLTELVIGIDGEVAMVKGIQTEFPETMHTLCMRYIKENTNQKLVEGRTGLVVRASDSGSGDPGSILGRVGVLFP